MSFVYMVLFMFEVMFGLLMIILVLVYVFKGDGMVGIGNLVMFFMGKCGVEVGFDCLIWVVFGFFMVVCIVLGFGFIK